MMRTGRYKLLPLAGMALATLGYGAFAFTAAAYSEALHVGIMAAIGAGIGMVFPVVTISVQNAVPARNLGIATSANGLARALGGAIGVAILGAVLTGALAQMMQAIGGARFEGAATLAKLAPAPRAQMLAAAEAAYSTMFFVCAAMTSMALAAALFMKELPLRTRAHAGAAAGE
jgi:hypothetical protein